MMQPFKFQVNPGIKFQQKRKVIESVLSDVLDEEIDPENNIKKPLVIPLHNENAESSFCGFRVPVKTTDCIESKENLEDNSLDEDKVDSLVIPVNGISNDVPRKKPLLLAYKATELADVQGEDEKFKRDISLRANDMDFKSDAYKAVPVEEFGAALLRGMGWEGHSKEDENRMEKQLKATLPRVGRLGIGAVPKPNEEKKFKTSGPITSISGNLKLQQEKELKKVWDQKISEKLNQQAFKIGDFIWLRCISEAGKRAMVVETKGVPGLSKIRVQLENEDRLVDISRTDAILVTADELTDKPFQHAEINLQIKDSTDNIQLQQTQPTKKIISEKESSSNKFSSISQASKQSIQSSWLFNMIRVRVISEKLGSKYYLQKGVVVDVYDCGVASVRLDSGVVIGSVKEKYLETVLPSVGGNCLILRGSNKGQTAQLLEKKKDKNEAIIQLSESFDVVIISMDDIAAVM